MNTFATLRFTIPGAGMSFLVLLAGCSNLLTPLGESTYDCNRKENPASPYCHSFKSVEASTSGAIPPSRYDETMRLSDFDRMTGIAPVPKSATSRDVASPAGVSVTALPLTPAGSLEGLPVRQGPVVQRVWVKRFVDGNDLLVGETVIYKEIIGSHWLGFGRGESPSGASSSSSQSSSARDGIPYPHRAPPPAQLKSAGGPTGATSVTSGTAPAAPPTSPGFTQPGARAPAGEMAPVPATSSGTTSMPQ